MTTNLQKQIDDLKQRVASLEDIVFQEKKSNRIKSHRKKKLSIREFLIEKKPSNDVEKTLAIGYYFEKYGDVSLFNVDNLQQGYEKAKEKRPINLNDKVNLNIKKGHIAEASEKKNNKKAWYVTNSGATFLENNFNGS